MFKTGSFAKVLLIQLCIYILSDPYEIYYVINIQKFYFISLNSTYDLLKIGKKTYANHYA